MLVAATPRGLCAVRFGENAAELERELREEFHAATFSRDDAALRPYLEPLLASLRGENVTIDLPLDVRATAFQKKVWDALREIPAGETRSYSEVAPRDWRSESGSRGCDERARAILWRWRCRVIAWCAAMANWRDIAGDWSARRSCCKQEAQ